MPDVRCLSIHATYRCGHSGACCTAGWPIPVEVGRLDRLRRAVGNGALQVRGTPAVADAPGGTGPATTAPADEAAFLFPPGAPEETPAVLRAHDGRCVFLDGAPGATSCRVHATLGHDALPLACRQFPRVSVMDPRGTSVTLSHYCPTAAALLEAPGPVEIVSSAPAFPAAGEYDGLDAARSLPPLLTPTLLMDWQAWWDWEARAVDRLANDPGPVEDRLARLRAAADRVAAWTPSAGPLLPAVARAFDDTRVRPADAGALSPARLAALVDDTLASVPEGLRGAIPPAVVAWRREASGRPSAERGTAGIGGPGTSGPGISAPGIGVPAPGAPVADERTLGRLLAAHAFGSWTAHLGRGLAAWVRSIEAVYALTRAGLGVREVDLVVRHLADPNVLARRYSAAMNG
ncbi:MAG: hypothetical protein R2752_00690 [Vicinamibacterales bacterium]